MSTHGKDQPASAVNARELEERYPQVAEQLRAEGAKAERDRIRSIEALGKHGHRQLLDRLKYEPGMTAGRAAVRIVSLEAERRAKTLRSLRADEAGLDAPVPSTDADGRSDEDKAVALILHAGEAETAKATARDAQRVG